MTIPGGFVAGDVLGAADMNLLPAGNVGYAQITADQTAIVAEADITSLAVTWTASSTRLYRISLCVNTQTVYDGSVGVSTRYIYITDGSNSKKKTVAYTPQLTVDTSSTLFTMTGAVLETGLSGSTTRKLRAACSLRVDVLASADNPSYILVEDIGPA